MTYETYERKARTALEDHGDVARAQVYALLAVGAAVNAAAEQPSGKPPATAKGGK